MNYFRRVRDALLCALLLAVPFFFLRANLRQPDQSNWLDRGIVQVSAPLQYVATRIAWTASTLFGEYVYLVDVKRSFHEAQRDNMLLSAEVDRLRMLELENRRLRRLLDLRERLSFDTLTAQVVGKEVSPFFRVVRIRLDRGIADRLQEGLPVVAADGLVGQVRRGGLSRQYADVRLLVDRSSKVDVVVQRSGARGVLQGTGELDRYLCRVQYLRREDDVRVGDAVHTSGYGKRFPPAILVGYVKRVENKELGIHQEVEIEPAVDFSDVREVLVLKSEQRPDASVGLIRD